ncbi:MAG: hypothetical protein AUK47_24615 [Deltaproteobacteria bacterium CG2_30_63_29]|nr:MAG: hypothetical protein AUK47_24615 [Deltaproteobacteria bacterium CG2_30_63_29]
MNLVFLLEEPSAKDLLEGLLPKLLPEGVTPYFLVFEGKQDLEKQLVKKLRGWRRPNSSFVVLRDQDSGNCKDVKAKLTKLVVESQREPVLVRVACTELECWILGDWAAVAQAFGQPKLSAHAAKPAFQNPDQIVRPVESLRKVIPDYQKRDGARRVGPLLDPDRNQSVSFQRFCSGLRRLVAKRA